MSGITRGLFRLMHRIVFKEIGSRIRTDALKNLTDLIYSLFEKISFQIPILVSIYMSLYDDAIEKEIKIADIKKDDEVLVIGCGALPATPVLIAKRVNANVTCIDHDITVIKKAEDFIRSMDLSDKVTVKHAEASEYPLDGFSVILIVYGVKKPETVMRHVAEHSDKNTRILLRATINNKNEISVNIPENLEVKNKIRLDSLGSVDSLLLTKR
jgi:precorrin-6B methylase 2